MRVIDPYIEAVLINIGINIIMTLSMYFPLAVGQLSLAQVGFMAIGAHLATVLTLYWQTPFALALLAVALVAWSIGLLLGHLIQRLQGLILAFATFAFMEIVQVFFLNFHLTGDARGMKGIAPLTQLWHVWVLVLGLLLCFYRLRTSRFGRAMRAVKTDETVAQSLGIDSRRVKTTAFAAGALVAGVGGALYAHYALYIQYSDFGPDKAMSIMTYAVFGGIDVWFGGMVGAAILSYMPVLLQVFEDWRLEVHGAIIIIVMSLRPQGVLAPGFIADVRALWQRFKKALTVDPQDYLSPLPYRWDERGRPPSPDT